MSKKLNGLFVDIDEQILPLVEAMNDLGWIQTLSSCQGHKDSEDFRHPYVAFFVDARHVSDLAKILDRAGSKLDTEADCEPVFLEVQFAYSTDLAGCQEDAPKGWIAFNLKIEPMRREDGPEFEYDREHVIKVLTQEFRKAKRRLRCQAKSTSKPFSKKQSNISLIG